MGTNEPYGFVFQFLSLSQGPFTTSDPRFSAVNPWSSLAINARLTSGRKII
jgi:hypothetical protein